MPYNKPDPTDPNVLVGVVLPGGEEATREMVYVFAEEYVRMGYSPEFIMGLCRNPFYRGLHAIWQKRGEEHVQALINGVLRQWRPRSAPNKPPAAGEEPPTKEKRDA